LVEAVLEGAKSRGAKTKIFYFGSLSINPCQACNSCKTEGRCILEDDMQQIYKAIDEADVLVFGTPIYYDHVSAQAKIFIDRLYAYSWKGFPKGVKAVIIITYEWRRPDGYNNVLEWIEKRFMNYHKIQTVAKLKAPNTTRQPVAKRPDLLMKARTIGESLVNRAEN